MYKRFDSQPDFKVIGITLFCCPAVFILLCVLIQWVTS